MDTVRLEIRERFQQFIERLRGDPPLRIPGTAIVLGRMAKGVPLALSHNVKCNHVLQENVLLVAVTTTEAPREPDEDRIVVAPIAEGITRAELRFGFMEEPNIPEGLAEAMARGKDCEIRSRPGDLLYRPRDDHPVRTATRDSPRWREAIFAFMHHNAQRPGAYFKIPGSQIMEIGVEFEI